MSTAMLVGILIVAIAMIVILIVKCKLHASIALVLAAFFVGISTGMPIDSIPNVVEKGVGGTLGFLTLIIGFGAILGKMLEVSGGAERIASTLLDKLGKSRATWVMMLVGFIAGIPVFVEVGFVLLVPLVLVVAKDAGISRLKVGLPLAVSLMTVHCIVPPHPAAMSIAATLGADVGKVIVFGLLVGLPCAIVGGPLFVKFFCGNVLDNEAASQTATTTTASLNKQLPSFGITLFTILLPLLIMVGKTLLVIWVAEGSALMPMIAFLGNPITALLISVFFAYWSLGLARGLNLTELLSISEKGFTPIAGILLIIGAGGAFSEVLAVSGVGNGLKEALSTLPVSPVVLAWLIAALLHFAVGSATVAMISAAGIVFPMLAGHPELKPEVMAIAIGAGAIALTQVTDSFFWLVKEYLGLSMTETIKRLTVSTTLASIVGLGGALLLNMVL
ncbi:GntT/GntP/DsdX family permease [Entomomonas asaccharolytica]|uniref:Permease DsdX n=1 Tax=Entomomonas asaccharolytica TaxID=2785331 RepID=A0A974NEB1_9GAMM|nr:gluconate:H+ symporter [Entomomonas asaccharolytica]QQP84842.1 permease DsdX [Entomomonas asaccharolytica]